ncbi:MAG: UDP-N-acetylmuramoyl-tripeptide--D-alanyl-D-alanine ligase [Saprospiraceae bacterium]|nr:UDP-N-acetylmuramoyl-tripeptide--D-alanyl-D-alanine ligase [Saprospiraceae bacterium]
MNLPVSYKRYLDQDRKLFTDTRKLIPEGVFIALQGPNFNGNTYAQEALERGAAYAIVDQQISNDPRCILVENTLSELQKMASINRQQCKAKIIAITGSNGKTTSKELMFSIFKLVFPTIATEGNLNNHIGVPLTLLRIDHNTEFAIVEMGANHPGNIAELCKIADPDVGIITSIGKAHLEGFGSFEKVIATKLELFDYLSAKNRPCFYNLFSALIANLFETKSSSISFGDVHSNAHYKAKLMQSFPTIVMEYFADQHKVEMQSKLFGSYNFQNMVAAASVASFFGIQIEDIKQGIESYVPANMRSQVLTMDRNTIILDAYNANPSSMREAIEAFDLMQFEQKWIILGEMAELGEYKETEHSELYNLVVGKKFDKKIFVGTIFENYATSQNVLVFPDVQICKNWLQEHWPNHTALFIKGSRSSGLEKLIH